MVAEEIRNNPQQFLWYHASYFNNISGKRIASVCDSDGCRAVTLALLEAEATEGNYFDCRIYRGHVSHMPNFSRVISKGPFLIVY